MNKVREVHLWGALIPFISMLGLVIVGHVIYEIDLRFILLLSAIIAGTTAYAYGVKVEQLFDTYGSNIKQAFPILLILMSIGGIVGTWMYSGTVPYLIYYGLQLIHPKFVLVSAFLVTAIVSTFTGTSWGAAATAGVAFMGIGGSMGIPLPMVAGAALSGAVFGDKVSPISDTTNLCSLASGITVYKHIKAMLPNIIIAAIITAAAYLILGFMYTGDVKDIGKVQAMITELDQLYNFNLFMLLPAALVFIGAYRGYNPVVLMIGSCVLAVFIGMLSNGFEPQDGAKALFAGFHHSMADSSLQISASLEILLNRGGFESMLGGAVLYAILAIGFGSFMMTFGALDRIMKALLSMVKTAFGLIITAFVGGGTLNAVSGNGAFSILTTGQLFLGPFRDKQLTPTILSRSMENSMTLLEPLLPWHVTGVYMTGIFGVATTLYTPYAFFNIVGIILFFILTKIEIGRKGHK